MSKYTIERSNGQSARTAESMKDALRISREWLCVSRVYRGAQYFTDRPSDDDGRETCNALDVWRNRIDASQQSAHAADVVISWRDK